ncbi:unnamed protein product [Callosobruchus maculatus]|uniref:Uncharacterized protein n=1 Tax=Callosobruchus maculatus TaxID=64391 RepID=A0A653BZI0_CALMS|nr:unnamed protein product [Callosobruchus maculatus]
MFFELSSIIEYYGGEVSIVRRMKNRNLPTILVLPRICEKYASFFV